MFPERSQRARPSIELLRRFLADEILRGKSTPESSGAIVAAPLPIVSPAIGTGIIVQSGNDPANCLQISGFQ